MYEIRIKDDRIPAYRVIKGQFLQDSEAKADTQKAILGGAMEPNAWIQASSRAPGKAD